MRSPATLLAPRWLLVASLLLEACAVEATVPSVTVNLTPEGGTLVFADGLAILDFPQGAVTQNTLVTLRVTTEAPASPLLVEGTVVEIEPKGLVFLQPVQMTVSYAGLTLPPGVQPAELRLSEADSTSWDALLGGTSNAADSTVTAGVSRLGVFGILGVPVVSIEVTPTAPALTVGGSLQMVAAPLDGSGTVLGQRPVAWVSENTSVATVSSSGLVSAVSPGGAGVVATSEGAADTVTVTVSAPSAVTPAFFDDFESGSRAPLQGGYGWAGVNSSTPVAGTGANGSFSRTSGQWIPDILVGRLVHLENTSSGSPVAVGPFVVTANNATTLFFSGNATGATRLRNDSPRVTNAQSYSGSYSLEFRYGPDRTDITDYSFSEQSFVLGANLAEVWIEYQLYIPSNYAHRDQVASSENNKFFMNIRADNYSAPDRVFVDLETDRHPTTGGSRLFAQTVHPTNGSAAVLTGPQVQVSDVISGSGALQPGQWHRIRVHVKVSSGAEVLDGIVELWSGDILLFQKTDARLWYPSNSALYATTPFFKNGYIQGYANSGYTEETLIYVDDFRIYSTNPNW